MAGPTIDVVVKSLVDTVLLSQPTEPVLPGLYISSSPESLLLDTGCESSPDDFETHGVNVKIPNPTDMIPVSFPPSQSLGTLRLDVVSDKKAFARRCAPTAHQHSPARYTYKSCDEARFPTSYHS
jgi:hypothetical protein